MKGIKAIRCTAYQGRWTDHRYNPYVYGQRGPAAAAYANGKGQLLIEAAEHDRSSKQREYLSEAYEDGEYQAGGNDGEFGNIMSPEQQCITLDEFGNPVPASGAGRPGAHKQQTQRETAKDSGEEDGEQMYDARQQQDQQSDDGGAGEQAMQQAGMEEWQMLGSGGGVWGRLARQRRGVFRLPRERLRRLPQVGAPDLPMEEFMYAIHAL